MCVSQSEGVCQCAIVCNLLLPGNRSFDGKDSKLSNDDQTILYFVSLTLGHLTEEKTLKRGHYIRISSFLLE